MDCFANIWVDVKAQSGQIIVNTQETSNPVILEQVYLPLIVWVMFIILAAILLIYEVRSPCLKHALKLGEAAN